MIYIFSILLVLIFSRQPASGDWGAWRSNAEIPIVFSACRAVVALAMMVLIPRITNELERRLRMPVPEAPAPAQVW
jgi:hypothetical protein